MTLWLRRMRLDSLSLKLLHVFTNDNGTVSSATEALKKILHFKAAFVVHKSLQHNAPFSTRKSPKWLRNWLDSLHFTSCLFCSMGYQKCNLFLGAKNDNAADHNLHLIFEMMLWVPHCYKIHFLYKIQSKKHELFLADIDTFSVSKISKKVILWP